MTTSKPHHDKNNDQQASEPEADSWENYVAKNHDRISKPALSRFFPLSVSETIRLFQSLEFAKPIHRTRVDITLLNPKGHQSTKIEVATLYPAQELLVFSFPIDIDPAFAKSLVERALREFAKIAKHDTNGYAGTSLHSVRAYYEPPDCLIITRMRESYKKAKYRGTSKFSNAFKSKGVRNDEHVIQTIEIG